MAILELYRKKRLTELFERARCGDRRAFQRAYGLLYPRVFRFVRRRVRDESTAEEIVSAVFQRVVTHIERFDAERASATAWVFSIARHALIDHYRSARAELSLDVLDDPHELQHLTANSEIHASDRELWQATERALGELTAPERTILALRFGDELSFEEIAEHLTTSVPAARKRCSRALEKLRTALLAFTHAEQVPYAPTHN